MTSPSITLVIGPASSGKSEWAEYLATQTNKQVIYVATATVDYDDEEWQAKITKHIQRRPTTWKTIAAPVDLAPVVLKGNFDTCMLVDSLGTWLANLMDQDEMAWEDTVEELVANLQQTSGEFIFVAEETGWGVVPAYPVGRTFRDRLGKLTRRLGTIANPVYLVTGGHVLNLSTMAIPLPNTKKVRKVLKYV